MSSFLKESHIRRKYIPRPNRENTIGFTVCINFADKLRHTLMYNLSILKNIIVVTTVSDSDTQNLCRSMDVPIIFSNKAFEGGAKFNKAGLIYEAQKSLHRTYRDNWIIYFDADTILPLDLDATLDKHTNYDDDTIYCMKRAIYNTQNDFDTMRESVVADAVGFFQMYFSKNRFYPSFSSSCGECDMFFEQKFKRKIILSGLCSHLGSTGQDWAGRTSEKWH